jgi:hypothetical protein
VLAIIIVSETENLIVSPRAQLWEPLSKTSAESFLKQDIPIPTRFGWYQKPKANGQPLACEERDCAGPPAALLEDSLAPVTSTENPANTNHDTLSLLLTWPSQGARDFLNRGNEFSANKNDPAVTQSSHCGIFIDEKGQMNSPFSTNSIDPVAKLASLLGKEEFDIEKLDAYLEYKEEVALSLSMSNQQLANQGPDPGCLPPEFQTLLGELPVLLSCQEMFPKAIATIQMIFCDDHELNVDHHLGHQVDTLTSPPETLQSGSSIFKSGAITNPQFFT